jgi:ion channel-forming bestrophin family protein
MSIIKFINDNWHKNHWLYIVFAKPNVYLKNLVIKTFLMGFVLVGIYFISLNFHLKEQTIPTNMHGLIGVVIGLTLSFRASSAYDRWWEARKILAELKANLVYIKIKLSREETNINVESTLCNINSLIFRFIKMSQGDRNDIKIEVYREIMELQKIVSSNSHLSNVDRKLSDLINSFAALERIKNSPIPQSYAIHIKMSIFAYLLSLPFGIFFSMGLFSIPLVMLLYFIIAGIEIISSEIEDPFGGSANDLPLDKYEKQNEYIIKSL